MENNADHSEQNNFSPITVQDVDVDFLPIVYEIVRSLERDFLDNSGKARELSQDCSQKVLELQKKLDSARAQVKQLPGIEYNKQDQLKQFEILRTQLRLKRELLQKYRNMCSFETSFKYLANNERLVQKIAESYPVRRAAQMAVAVFFRSKEKISDMDPQQVNRLVSFLKRWRQYMREGIEDAKKQIKK